eukprot:363784-Chlamydomonas_euryale.AAC.14
MARPRARLRRLDCPGGHVDRAVNVCVRGIDAAGYYQGMRLFSIAGKVYAALVLHCTVEHTRPRLYEVWSGFRKRRGTTHAMFTLRSSVNAVGRHQFPTTDEHSSGGTVAGTQVVWSTSAREQITRRSEQGHRGDCTSGWWGALSLPSGAYGKGA